MILAQDPASEAKQLIRLGMLSRQAREKSGRFAGYLVMKDCPPILGP